MKFRMKIVAVLILVVLVTVVHSDNDPNPNFTTAITTAATYVPVRLPSGYGCTSYLIWTQDETAFWIASDAAGTDGVLIPESKAGIGISKRHTSSAEGTIIQYVKGTTSTNLFGAFIWK